MKFINSLSFVMENETTISFAKNEIIYADISEKEAINNLNDCLCEFHTFSDLCIVVDETADKAFFNKAGKAVTKFEQCSTQEIAWVIVTYDDGSEKQMLAPCGDQEIEIDEFGNLIISICEMIDDDIDDEDNDVQDEPEFEDSPDNDGDGCTCQHDCSQCNGFEERYGDEREVEEDEDASEEKECDSDEIMDTLKGLQGLTDFLTYVCKLSN